MELLGYSERGLINSLLYAIRSSSKGDELLQQLLALVHFPFQPTAPSFAGAKASIMVEQSFSDFGDADATVLLDYPAGIQPEKATIFLEGKVRAQRPKWSINSEFQQFLAEIEEGKVESSNLFTQLYHKVRLMDALGCGSLDQAKNGVDFPGCSSRAKRRIGRNPVVLRAAQKVLDHRETRYFVALTPGNASKVDDFFTNTLHKSEPNGFMGWDVDRWGYLTWAEIEEFCEHKLLVDVKQTFRFNHGQIY